MNRDLTKAFNAGGTIASYTFVKFGADKDTVVQAAAATDKLMGAVQLVAPPGSTLASGNRVDVQLEDIADIKLGGTVAFGDFLTSDANGCGVTAAPAAGVNNRSAGMALADGVAGDIIPVHLNFTSIQG